MQLGPPIMNTATAMEHTEVLYLLIQAAGLFESLMFSNYGGHAQRVFKNMPYLQGIPTLNSTLPATALSTRCLGDCCLQDLLLTSHIA